MNKLTMIAAVAALSLSIAPAFGAVPSRGMSSLRAPAPEQTRVTAPYASKAYDYADAYSANSNFSGPVCRPGTMVRMENGELYPCQ